MALNTRFTNSRKILIGILTLFALAAVPYLGSDLWFDELVSIYDFAIKPDLSDIFLKYPVANNHILYNSLLWGWLKLTRYTLSEELLRLPGLFIALLTLSIMFRHIKSLIDLEAAVYATLMLGFSPVFLNFFWQLRGYGLTILLATTAMFGVLYVAMNEVGKGLRRFIPAALALPGIMPGNTIYTAGLFVFVLLVYRRQRRIKSQFPVLLLIAVSAIAGLSIYIPVRSQFLTVVRTTQGWDFGWQVIAHWLIAIGSHCGIFVLVVSLFKLKKVFPESPPENRNGSGSQTPENDDGNAGFESRLGRMRAEEADSGDNVRRFLPLLLITSLSFIAIGALIRSPFPRVFLAFLAPITICSMYGLRDYTPPPYRHLFVVTIIVVNSVGWCVYARHDSQRSLAAGEYPQDLLRQYYTCNNDMSRTAVQLLDNPQIPEHARILVDFHFFPTLHHYWRIFGGDISRIECLNGGDRAPLKLPANAYRELPQYLIAYNVDRAASSYQQTLGVASVHFEPTDISDLIFRVMPVTR